MDDQGVPPPPAPPPPPPTASAPMVTPPDVEAPPRDSTGHDNPIAVAGLVVSVLALVLSIVVIGFFIAIAGFALCAIGWRRSRRGLRGRGIALTGMIIAVLAMLFSVVAVFAIASIVDSGETTVRNGIATTSDNQTHPPQDDIDGIECSASNSGRLAQAEVTITNRSEGSSVYEITIAWDTDGEPINETVTSGYVAVGERATFEAVDLSGRAEHDTCRVTSIERWFLPFPLL